MRRPAIMPNEISQDEFRLAEQFLINQLLVPDGKGGVQRDGGEYARPKKDEPIPVGLTWGMLVVCVGWYGALRSLGDDEPAGCWEDYEMSGDN